MSEAELSELKSRHASLKLEFEQLQSAVPPGKEESEAHKHKVHGAKVRVDKLAKRIEDGEKEMRD
jgi:septal ring factor EnvC (AmiA/AmiB activator)